MVTIKSLNSNDTGFLDELNQLLAFDSSTDQQVKQTVETILNDVKKEGDKAVVEYTNRFDRMQANGISDLVLNMLPNKLFALL